MPDTVKVFASRNVRLFRGEEGRAEPTTWRVVGVSGDQLAVSATRHEASHVPEAGERVVVQSGHRDAAYQMPALVVQSTVRYGVTLILEKAGDIKRVQRRRHVRVPLKLPTKMVEIVSEPAEAMRLETEDVSAGGVRVHAPRAVKPGQLVLTTLDLGDGKPPIVCQARVARCQEGEHVFYELGVCLHGIQEVDQDRISALLTERTRLMIHAVKEPASTKA